MGISTNISILKFLSFYQVLEFFFIKVSNELLYQKLSSLIIDPKFRANSTNSLDKLILTVQGHDQNTTEGEMLKNVISKFVIEKDLVEFIKKYEDYIGIKLYTKQQEIFGELIAPSKEGGHTFGNVSKRIKIIRNALVHSKDQYDRFEKHIPFSESTKIVEREVPLVKFLAEKAIISSVSVISNEN